jgi:putative SbcD/Mre11-related phosphoesterase
MARKILGISLQRNEPKFITNAPAVLIGDTLVIADLHIGVEFEFYSSGIKIPSNTKSMLREIESLADFTGAKKLVILGDLKHKVPGTTRQELREVPDFLHALGARLDVSVVPGNHDGKLKNLIPGNVRLRSGRGFGEGECYFLHGNSWPAEEFLEKKYVFVGHEHPQIEFRDALGHRFTEPVWIRAELDGKKIRKKYKSAPGKLPELIMVPRFNRLSGGIAFNSPLHEIEKVHMAHETGIGTLVRSAKLGSSKVYLLDGTFLGKLAGLF